MPEPTIKRRLAKTRDRELADDDGPIFSTVAKLVDALSLKLGQMFAYPRPRGAGQFRHIPYAAPVLSSVLPEHREPQKCRSNSSRISAIRSANVQLMKFEQRNC